MIKVGDEITMYFHYAGLVSKEKTVVVEVDDKFVHLDRGGDEPWKFDMKTGECLNDNTWGGARRTIEACHTSKI